MIRVRPRGRIRPAGPNVEAMTRRTVTPQRYVTYTKAALWLLSIIVVSGGAVRLTGSGLGCSDWPNCEEDQFFSELEYHNISSPSSSTTT